jgi:hypothetical protein
MLGTATPAWIAYARPILGTRVRRNGDRKLVKARSVLNRVMILELVRRRRRRRRRWTKGLLSYCM